MLAISTGTPHRFEPVTVGIIYKQTKHVMLEAMGNLVITAITIDGIHTYKLQYERKGKNRNSVAYNRTWS